MRSIVGVLLPLIVVVLAVSYVSILNIIMLLVVMVRERPASNECLNEGCLRTHTSRTSLTSTDTQSTSVSLIYPSMSNSTCKAVYVDVDSSRPLCPLTRFADALLAY